MYNTIIQLHARVIFYSTISIIDYRQCNAMDVTIQYSISPVELLQYHMSMTIFVAVYITLIWLSQ